MIELPDDEVHLWTASRDVAAPEAQAALRACLDEAECRRADRFAFEEDRLRFAAGRGLLRVILGRYLGRDPGSLRFVHNAHGKPELAPDHAANLRFNLAHSGHLVVYALTRGRDLGVDIERIRPDFGGEAIAARFFAPGETAELRALPEETRILGFFHGWTRKEAYIKAQGKGLALPLDDFDVRLSPGQPAALLATRPDPLEAARWSLVEVPTQPGYVAALCVEGGGWSLRRGQWAIDGPDQDPPLSPRSLP
jgi:4'-phosphopantetheinyl transferase